MVYEPNANWTAKVADKQQVPIYFIRVSGVTTKDWSTKENLVNPGSVTKVVAMNTPRGGATSLDIIDGAQATTDVQVDLIDVAGAVTSDLIATDSPLGLVSTLVNREVTIFGGYVGLSEVDYAPIFTGKIVGLSALPDMVGYRLQISSLDRLLSGQIMTTATPTQPVTITGNPVNLYYAILANDFSAVGDFPLTSISTDTGSSKAPIGLGIPTASLNLTQMQSERDRWHIDDAVTVVWNDPVDALQYLKQEFFRIFQAWTPISGDGKLGLKFHAPPLPPGSAPTIVRNQIVRVVSWRRIMEDHLNKFTIKGDYNASTDVFDTVLYNTVLAGDTTNQTDTNEIIEYVAESKWLKSSLNGVELARELAGRLRIRYRDTPVALEIELPFTERAFEAGDAVAITHPEIPDLRLGTRGIVSRTMTIISINPNFIDGTLRLMLLDTGLKRYGTIMPVASSKDYGAASAIEREQFGFIGAVTTNLVGGTDEGYFHT